MTTRKPTFVREFDKRNVALDSFVHEVFRSTLLPWRQPAAACNRWRSHASVGLSEMSLECEYRMVQEQHAGVFRVFQRGENRQSQMVCDGIDFAMRPREAADSGSAVIVGYFIEGRSRQVEMDGVERIWQEHRWSLLQIENADAPLRIPTDGDRPVVQPQLVKGTFPKLKGDDKGLLVRDGRRDFGKTCVASQARHNHAGLPKRLNLDRMCFVRSEIGRHAMTPGPFLGLRRRRDVEVDRTEVGARCDQGLHLNPAELNCR